MICPRPNQFLLHLLQKHTSNQMTNVQQQHTATVKVLTKNRDIPAFYRVVFLPKPNQTLTIALSRLFFNTNVFWYTKTTDVVLATGLSDQKTLLYVVLEGTDKQRVLLFNSEDLLCFLLLRRPSRVLAVDLSTDSTTVSESNSRMDECMTKYVQASVYTVIVDSVHTPAGCRRDRTEPVIHATIKCS